MPIHRHSFAGSRFPLAFALIFVSAPPASDAVAGWVHDGASVCTASGAQTQPAIVRDDRGGAIIAWMDGRAGSFDIYAQRIDARGDARWRDGGERICSASTLSFRLVSDMRGGAIVVWEDAGFGSADIFAQRIDSSGVLCWASGGVPVCVASGEQSSPSAESDIEGGAFIAWTDFRGGSRSDVYAQRIDADGMPRWTVNGVALCAAASDQTDSRIVPMSDGDAIAAWRDLRSGLQWDIYAQRVLPTGSPAWTIDGIAVCLAAGHKRVFELAPDGADGAIAAWSDQRSVAADIYAQRISGAGDTLWSADGVCVCGAGYGQTNPRLIPDQEGGAIVVWEDCRRDNYLPDIYAQKITGSGLAEWEENGVPLCTAKGGQYRPRIVGDGDGGAIAGWVDDRYYEIPGQPYDIFAARVLPDGGLPWPSYAGRICLMTGSQDDLRLIADGAGGAIAAWTDYRGADADIYAQRLDAGGNPTATSLRGFSVSANEGTIEVVWSLSSLDEGASFRVSRSRGLSDDFGELSAAIAADGLSFSFIDREVDPGASYRYRVAVIVGDERTTLFETGEIAVPSPRFALLGNHPNPFNPSTTIRYSISAECRVTLAVHNVSGKRIRSLFAGVRAPGTHLAEWDGADASGRPAASGVYYCVLAAGKFSRACVMILLR
jgi:hypothetical protein